MDTEAHARVIVTGRSLLEARRTVRALRRALPGFWVHGTGFTGVFVVEAEGDPLEIAERVMRKCGNRIGHATAVAAEATSEVEPVKEAAVRVGLTHVAPGESFCFRVHKRGSHLLTAPTPELELNIGSAIWHALEERDGRAPRVDLKSPDVTVIAEVLGPVTAVGVVRKAWKALAAPEEEEAEAAPPGR